MTCVGKKYYLCTMKKVNLNSSDDKRSAEYLGNSLAVFNTLVEVGKYGNEPILLEGFVGLMVKNGHGYVDVGEERIEINSGDLFFCSPRNVLEGGMFSSDILIQGIFMSPEYAADLASGVDISWSFNFMVTSHQVIHCSPDQQELVMRYHEILTILLKAEDTNNKRNSVSAVLQSMMYFLADTADVDMVQPEELKYTSAESIFQQFWSLLNEKGNNKRSVNDYADALNISSKYFSAVCKKVSGKTASEIITGHTITQAKVLLRDNKKSIKQIASLLGFANQSHFGKYFRNVMGVSPQQYRDKL